MSLGWCDTHVAAPHTSCGSTARAMAMAESRGTGFCALETSRYPHPVLFKRGAAHREAPVSARVGCGAAHRNHPERPPSASARAHASHHTRRVRAQGLCAPQGSPPPAVPHDSAPVPGAAHRDPVRRQARLLPSRSAGDIAPSRRRWSASTGARRPGPADAPRRSRPCPGRGCARRGPETVGPPAGCGGTGPRLPRRPPGGTPGRSSCRRSQTAGPRMPGRR
jgi:hypothetical protein